MYDYGIRELITKLPDNKFHKIYIWKSSVYANFNIYTTHQSINKLILQLIKI
jgi:hypothetical protein